MRNFQLNTCISNNTIIDTISPETTKNKNSYTHWHRTQTLPSSHICATVIFRLKMLLEQIFVFPIKFDKLTFYGRNTWFSLLELNRTNRQSRRMRSNRSRNRNTLAKRKRLAKKHKWHPKILLRFLYLISFFFFFFFPFEHFSWNVIWVWAQIQWFEMLTLFFPLSLGWMCICVCIFFFVHFVHRSTFVFTRKHACAPGYQMVEWRSDSHTHNHILIFNMQ